MNREAIAYHEAGHTVASFFLTGKAPKRATIVATEEARGMVTHHSPLKGIRLDIDNGDRVHMRGQREIMICLAGPIAERKYAPRSFRNYHASSDHRQAVDIALALNGNGESATAFLRWLEICTKTLVDGRWQSIDAVAKALLAKSTLDSMEIRTAIDPRYQ